jgi:hypothetical protein
MPKREDGRTRSRGAAAAWVLPPLLAVVVAATALPGVMQHRLPSAPPLGQVWIATTPTLAHLRAFDLQASALFFDRSTSFVLGGAGTTAIAARAWSDGASFEADLASGAIPPQVRYVMYDPEGWASTPRGERRHPVAAMRAFARAARAAGYGVIITPHPSLVEVQRAACRAAPNEKESAAYLRCGIGAAAARLSDVVEIQAQWLEWDPPAYRAFVEAAAGQARDVNPDVVVVAGLSTRYAADPGDLLDAWDSVSDIVDGHYLAVPEGINPQIAASFLRTLAEQRG